MRTRSAGWLLALLLCVGAWAQENDAAHTTPPPDLDPVSAAQPIAQLPSPEAEPSPPLATMSDDEQRKMEDVYRAYDAEPAAAGASDIRNTPPRDQSLFEISLKALAGLFVVIALILAVRVALTRWGSRSGLFTAPKLARPIGRLYLDKGICLHFVVMGGRVLVIGATPQSVQLVAEFDEAAFDPQLLRGAPVATAPARSPEAQLSPMPPQEKPAPRARFADYLKTSAQNMLRPETTPVEEEDDLSSLRTDIQRLQEYLRELPRDHKD